MRGPVKKILKGRFLGRGGGFTLVEMLVVVGIIVALAAVILPGVALFVGRGNEGSEQMEVDIVQTAMYAMMADEGLTDIPAHNGPGDARIQNWSTLPASPGAPLSGYLTEVNTAYYYCYDSAGRVSRFVASGTCA